MVSLMKRNATVAHQEVRTAGVQAADSWQCRLPVRRHCSHSVRRTQVHLHAGCCRRLHSCRTGNRCCPSRDSQTALCRRENPLQVELRHRCSWSSTGNALRPTKTVFERPSGERRGSSGGCRSQGRPPPEGTLELERTVSCFIVGVAVVELKDGAGGNSLLPALAA